jgi:hypothetical protein
MKRETVIEVAKVVGIAAFPVGLAVLGLLISKLIG